MRPGLVDEWAPAVPRALPTSMNKSANIASGTARSSPERLAHALADRFIRPSNEVALARLRTAQEQHQLAVDADPPLLVERLYGPIHYRILVHLGPYSRSSIRALITDTLGPLQGGASGPISTPVVQSYSS